jgi:ribonucleoside-triphosphate reductase
VEEIVGVQKIFCEWFAKGQRTDADGPHEVLPYPFPVVTLNIKVDDEKRVLDQDSFEHFCRVNMNGLFNFFVSGSNKLASCCRVVNNLDVHMSIFGDGGVNIGSLRVVTINLARVGHLARTLERFKADVLRRLDDARALLLSHRQFILSNIERGACPFFDKELGFMSMGRFFLTFGINGLYEGLLEMGLDIVTPEGLAAAEDILSFITTYANDACDVPNKILFNVEQVPAESLAAKHAKKDKLLHGIDYEIYANQFVPLWMDVDIEDRLRIDGRLTKFMSGGCITHVNLTEPVQSELQMRRLVECAIRHNAEHVAVNFCFNVCQNDHVTVSGKANECPICGAKIVERFTRIVGYFTRVSAWSPARKAEFAMRKFDNAALV